MSNYYMISHRVVNGYNQIATANILNARYSDDIVGYNCCSEFIDNLKLADNTNWSKSDKVIDSYMNVDSDNNHDVTGIADYTLILKNINATGFTKIFTVHLKDCNSTNLLDKLNTHIKNVTQSFVGKSYNINNFIIVNAIINIR